ncbi:Ig-like domain-containing protein [Endobacterium cereale]|uniref:T1SS-143 repeat domain-containing protein n=1 Tax=Endobacterium cereale TaxID=2663029 RepID=UPI001AD950DC|nr:Ig-like domain-containing protein [Endobacterium cereale]
MPTRRSRPVVPVLCSGVKVTDGDGDTASATLNVNVNDDAPVAKVVTASRVLDDEAQGVFTPTNPGSNLPFDLSDVRNDVKAVSGNAGALFTAGSDGVHSVAINGPAFEVIYKNNLGFARTEGVTWDDGSVENGVTTFTATGVTSGLAAAVLVIRPDGSYSFEMKAPLAHSDASPWIEENETLSIGFTVKDGDGDTASGSLKIAINDDTPTPVVSIVSGRTLDDEAQAVFTPVNTGGLDDVAPDYKQASGGPGSLFRMGADGLGSIGIDLPGFGVIAKVGGFAVVEAVSWSAGVQSANGVTTYTAKSTSYQGGAAVLEIRADGSYTFTLNAPVAHSVPGTSEEDKLLTFGYVVKDGDGDAAAGVLTIRVDDDTPKGFVTTASTVLDDEAQAVFAGNNTPADNVANEKVATGNAGSLFTAGADGVRSVAISGGAFDVIYKGTDGLARTESVSWSGGTKGTDGSTTFTATSGHYTSAATLVINADGSYTFTLNAPVAHSATAGSTGTEETQAISFGVKVTDGDGDTASATLNVNVNDDAPTISATWTQRAGVNDDALAGGNRETSDKSTATGTLSHSFGADGGSISWQLSTLPTKGGYTQTINGNVFETYQQQNGAPVKVFTVTLDPLSGAYTVQQLAAVRHPNGADELGEGFDLKYRVTDGDGDYVESHLRVVVGDDVPIAVADSYVVAEDSGATSFASGLLVNDKPGADGAVLHQVSFGNGEFVNLTSGQAISAGYSFSVSGVGTYVFKASGEWLFTPVKDYNGPAGFQYKLIDGDGDISIAAPVTLTVTAINDAPVLHALPSQSITIVNAGFEADTSYGSVGNEGQWSDGSPQGWQVTGGAGWYDPNNGSLPMPSENGANVLYLNDGASVGQTLAATAVAGTYTLGFDIGDRHDGNLPGMPAFAVRIYSGTTLLKEMLFESFQTNGADWRDGSVTLTIPAGSAAIGGALRIEFQNLEGVNGRNDFPSIAQVNIDNVSLSVVPAAVAMVSIDEDAINNVGQTVASILGDSVTDVDAGSVEGVAIYAADNGNGTWQYLKAGVWTDFGAVSQSGALLLTANDTVRFLPNAANGTTASFSYHAWDQTSGAAQAKADIAIRGGETAFSDASGSAMITVTSVNDVPVLSDTTDPVAIAESVNASAQQLNISGNFSVTDPDIGDTLTPSIIGNPVVQLNGETYTLPSGASTLVASGALILNGAVSTGGAVDIGYSYNPVANLDFLKAGETLTITYKIKVGDGTAETGTQDVTFTITGTNDAPVIAITDGNTVTSHTELDGSDPVGSFIFKDLKIAVSDVDGNAFTKAVIVLSKGESGDNLNMFATAGQREVSGGVLINYETRETTVNGVKTITMTLVNAKAGEMLTATQVDEALDLVRFHTGDRVSAETPVRDIAITVYDQNGLASSAANITLNVKGTNDTPTWENTTLAATTSEDHALSLNVFTPAQLKVGDRDASGDAKLTLTVKNGTLEIIASNSIAVTGHGTNTVTLTGSMSAINDLLVKISGGVSTSGVTYKPDLNFNGTDTLTLVFSDNGDLNLPAKQATATIAINVTPVNDAPTAIHFHAQQQGFQVTVAHSTGYIQSLADADSVLAGSSQKSLSNSIASTVNFGDGGQAGNNETLPAFGGDEFAVRAVGSFVLEAAGVWTFATNSDDGVRLVIDGKVVITDNGIHPALNNLVQVDLTAGIHTIELVYFEHQGGEVVELFAQLGSHATFNSGFRLVGDVAGGGLPVFAVGTNTLSINENGGAHMLVATLSASDPDVGDTHTYSLVNGAGDNAAFTMEGNKLYLTANADFEAKQSYSITVEVKDAGGLTHQETRTIYVNNLNDAPTDIQLGSNSVTENVKGAIIGQLTTVDQDAGDSHTYTVDDNRFEVANGKLQLKAGISLDYEATPTVDVKVTSTDLGNKQISKTFTINVGDVDDTPPAVSSIVMEKSALKAGETSLVTITFSEKVTNFSKQDVTPQGGSLGTFSSLDGGKTWTAIFTPTTNVENTANVIKVAATYTDLAGNAGTAAQSGNYTVDTKAPTVMSIVMSDADLKVGETSTVTITFSEKVVNFDRSDVNTPNGTLGVLTSSSDGKVWTGTFTPSADIKDTTNVITVANSYNDNAGNTGITGQGPNYKIDTVPVNQPPIAGADTLFVSDASLVVIPWAMLLGNDSDPEGSALTITGVSKLSGIAGGNIDVSIDEVAKTVTFKTPNLWDYWNYVDDVSGNSFTYTVSDAQGKTSTQTVTIKVIDTDEFGRTFTVSGSYNGSYLEGHGGNDRLTGGSAIDFLNGSSGDDTLKGMDGNDVLIGGSGNDELHGGKGADLFKWTEGNSFIAFNRDVIKDYSYAEGDKIDLQDLVGGTITSPTIADNQIRVVIRGNDLLVQYFGIFSGWSTVYTLEDAKTAPYSSVRLHFGNNDWTFTINSLGQQMVSKATDPIILDLDHNGFAFTQLDNGVSFDIDADGHKDKLAWTSTDGILAYDIDGNGKIDNGSELFTPSFNGGGHASGIAALATLDSNGDGKIDAEDDAFSKMSIWIDANHNGISDDGELSGLLDHSIKSISLDTTATGATEDGQTVLSEGHFMLDDGSTGNFLEVGFDTLLGGQPDHVLIGGDGNDVLVGGPGFTQFTGGAGADTFVLDPSALSSLDMADVVTDYKAGEGDVLDVSKLLDTMLGHQASEQEAAATIKTTVTGNDTTVSVQMDDGWKDVAVLQNHVEAVKILFDDKHTIDVSHH